MFDNNKCPMGLSVFTGCKPVISIIYPPTAMSARFDRLYFVLNVDVIRLIRATLAVCYLQNLILDLPRLGKIILINNTL